MAKSKIDYMSKAAQEDRQLFEMEMHIHRQLISRSNLYHANMITHREYDTITKRILRLAKDHNIEIGLL
jgi:hypothetical protein